MPHRLAFVLFSCVALSSCGDSSKSTAQKQPARMACTTPELAGQKAADITRRLVEARKNGTITQDQYANLNLTLSNGLRAWAERQDLSAYCLALDRVSQDVNLR